MRVINSRCGTETFSQSTRTLQCQPKMPSRVQLGGTYNSRLSQISIYCHWMEMVNLGVCINHLVILLYLVLSDSNGKYYQKRNYDK